MMNSRAGLSVLIMCGLTACAARAIDLEAERQSLLAADVSFDRRSGQKGPADAFSHYLADRALSLPRNGPPVSGRQEIVQGLAGDYSLRWEPKDAVVSENADMGYTWGTWLLTVNTESGALETRGKYLDVWVKDNGEWKIQVDIGNQADPLPE